MMDFSRFSVSIFSFLVAVLSVVGGSAQTPQREANPAEVRSGLGLEAQPFSTLVVSGDSRWVSFSTTKGEAFLNVHDGKRFNGREGWATNGASWSPVGSVLAFRVYKEGKIFLDVWDPSTDRDRQLIVFPRRMYPGNPVWSADGKTLFMILNLDLPWPKSRAADDNPPTDSPNAHLYVTAPYRQSSEYQRYKKLYQDAYAENHRTLILAIDVASGETRLVGKGNDIDSLYPSPNEKWLAVPQVKKTLPGRETSVTGQVLTDIYLVPLGAFLDQPVVDLEKFDDRSAGWYDAAGNRLSPALTDLDINDSNPWSPPLLQGNGGNPLVVWSPDSSRFAYATTGRKATGDVFTYDPAAKRLVNLTGSVVLPPWSKDLGYGENYTWKYSSPKFGGIFPPLWLPDGKSLVALGHGDVWLISSDGSVAARDLTKDLPFETVRIVPAPARNVAAADAAGGLVIIAKDKTSRLDSVFKVDPASARTTRIKDLEAWVQIQLSADQVAGDLFYLGTTEKTDQNVFQLSLDDAAKLDNLTRFKMQLADRQYPETRRLSWTTPGGAKAFGLLYLPGGASAEHRVPMILSGTPGDWESRVDERARHGARALQDSVLGFLKDGIAVLDPDLPLSDMGVYEHPMKQIVEGVNAAVDAALGTGLIDDTKVGILGIGYGGFMAQAVVTQTDRFKCAVSIGGFADWTADYLGGSHSNQASYYETGEGRFGQPPWVDPTRYTENSPSSYLDRVHTPILLIHGENDGVVAIARDQQTFRSLDRLDRTVIFSFEKRWPYPSPRDEEKIRIRAWFAEYLLGEKPTAHIAKIPSFFFGSP